MWFRSLFNSQKSRASVAGRRRSSKRPTSRLQVEALEDRSVPSAYIQANLAGDAPGDALIHDTDLVGAWGISLNPNGTFWVSARETGVSTVYSGDVTQPDGTRIPFIKSALTVTTPGGGTTGQVFSGSATDFMVSAVDGAGNLDTAPARFIFVGEGGHLTGWAASVPSPPAPSRNAQLMGTTPDAVYTGMAIGNNGSGNFLYASDFRNGEIDVFDRTYAPTTLAGSFVDPTIPADYDPFNIWNLGGKLYVTYAKQVDGDALPDGGTGFVSVFDTNGNFLQRIVSETDLNEPWGLAIAPGDFGEFSNALLVGNFGDGTINAYNSSTGAYLGDLRDGTGEVVEIDGLLGLHFGNGTASGDRNALYFAAGPDAGAHGLFGSLRLAPAKVASVVVNDGSAQRSMVKSLTVNFDGQVTVDAGAFELSRPDGTLVGLNVATSIVNGRTVALLTFADPGLVGGSLADGNYSLTVRGSLVHDATGRSLDGDEDGEAGGDSSDAFFRLYGDSDGDRDVDLHDLGRFLSTLGRRAGDAGYLSYFDINGDDRVGLIDLFGFIGRFGKYLNP